MYKNVLAAVNEHLNSEVAARYALQLAKATGSRLFISYIAEKDVSDAEFRQAEDAVKRLFHSAREMEVPAESIVDSGDPVERIRHIVKAEDIDIVFAATRQEDIKRRFYEGTKAKRLSVGLPCSVALCRVVHLGRIHPKKVLIPLKARIDHIGERAYFSAMISAGFDAELYLMHSSKPVTSFFHGEIHQTHIERVKRLPKDFSRFVGLLNGYGVTHEKRAVTGKTGRGITIEAAAKRFDLIVMGASGRSLVTSILEGNPVEEVLRHTPCDLIILKAGHEDK